MKIHKANKESVPTVSKDQADSKDIQLMEENEEEFDTESVSASGSQVGIGAKKKTLAQLKVKALEKYPLLMPIMESKVFYPTSQDSMHATGVDEGMLHHRQKVGDKGFYECAFDGKCEYVALPMASRPLMSGGSTSGIHWAADSAHLNCGGRPGIGLITWTSSMLTNQSLKLYSSTPVP